MSFRPLQVPYYIVHNQCSISSAGIRHIRTASHAHSAHICRCQGNPVYHHTICQPCPSALTAQYSLHTAVQAAFPICSDNTRQYCLYQTQDMYTLSPPSAYPCTPTQSFLFSASAHTLQGKDTAYVCYFLLPFYTPLSVPLHHCTCPHQYGSIFLFLQAAVHTHRNLNTR